MWLILSLILFFILFFSLRRNDFDSIFISLSVFYIFIFFVMPLFYIESDPNAYYLSSRIPYSGDAAFRVITAFSIFMLGFFSFGIFGIFRREYTQSYNGNYIGPLKIGNFDRTKKKVTIIFWIFFIIICMKYSYNIVDASRAEYAYLVRKGDLEGSWLSFFISIITSVVSIAILFSAIYSGKKMVFYALVLFVLANLLTGSVSRGGLLVFLSVVAIYLFKLKSNIFVLIMFLVIPVSLPILINLKAVIYSISVLNEVPDFYGYYSIGASVNAILANFAHPLVSLIFVDGIIDRTGFRYFYDYLHGILFYFRLVGIDFGDSLTSFNTYVFLGRNISIIPTGYLAFGYVQLSFVGVFVAGIFYRFTGFYAKRVYERFASNAGDAAKFYFANAAAYTFYTGDIVTLVMNFFAPLFFVLMLSKLFISKA